MPSVVQRPVAEDTVAEDRVEVVDRRSRQTVLSLQPAPDAPPASIDAVIAKLRIELKPSGPVVMVRPGGHRKAHAHLPQDLRFVAGLVCSALFEIAPRAVARRCCTWLGRLGPVGRIIRSTGGDFGIGVGSSYTYGARLGGWWALPTMHVPSLNEVAGRDRQNVFGWDVAGYTLAGGVGAGPKGVTHLKSIVRRGGVSGVTTWFAGYRGEKSNTFIVNLPFVGSVGLGHGAHGPSFVAYVGIPMWMSAVLAAKLGQHVPPLFMMVSFHSELLGWITRRTAYATRGVQRADDYVHHGLATAARALGLGRLVDRLSKRKDSGRSGSEGDGGDAEAAVGDGF